MSIPGFTENCASSIAQELAYNCGLPRAGAAALARYISRLEKRCEELEQRITTLETNLRNTAPPHLAQVEKRTALKP
jgi:ubiquinone biosynthesis protein UbiJ